MDLPLAWQCICILGMHRSGTSAWTRVLNLLGMRLGSDLLPAGWDNPKGFFEDRRIVRIHEELLAALGTFFDDFAPLPDGWIANPAIAPMRRQLIALHQSEFADAPLWGFKDPRVCRLVPLWREILSAIGSEAKFLLVLRDPMEIALSLEKRNGWSINKCLALTLAHLIPAERETRDLPRMRVSFDELLRDWRAATANVAAGLSLEFPVAPENAAAIGEYLDPQMRNHRPAGLATTRHCDTRLRDLAVGLDAMLRQPTLPAGAIDQIAGDFQAMMPRLLGWRQSHSPDTELAKYLEGNRFLLAENQWFREEIKRLKGGEAGG